MADYKIRKMVGIEPVMDFDPQPLLAWIRAIAPEFVSIGADSKKCDLPEPSATRLIGFINALRSLTEVRTKSNLNRLLKETTCLATSA